MPDRNGRRRQHAETMARLQEQEKQEEIARKQAEIAEAYARARKDRQEAERLGAEAALKRAEAEKLSLENEKLRLELHKAKIELALQVLGMVAPTMPEAERIVYVVKLLPPLDVLTGSPLQIASQ